MPAHVARKHADPATRPVAAASGTDGGFEEF